MTHADVISDHDAVLYISNILSNPKKLSCKKVCSPQECFVKKDVKGSREMAVMVKGVARNF